MTGTKQIEAAHKAVQEAKKERPARAKCEVCGKVKLVAFRSDCDCHTFGICSDCGLPASENKRHEIFTTAWTEFKHKKICGMWFKRERR